MLGGRGDPDVVDRIGAAQRADGGELVDPLGLRHERRQRLERLAGEGHIQACHDHRKAARREVGDHGRQAGAEELGLVDGDEIGLSRSTADSISAAEAAVRDGASRPACEAIRAPPARVSSAWLKTTTRWPAIAARRTRRSSSSVLPANIGPAMTSTRPPAVIGLGNGG